MKKKFEGFLLLVTGVSIPLINLRIDLPFYSLNLYMVSIILLSIYLLITNGLYKGEFIKINIGKHEIFIYLFIMSILFSILYSVNQPYGIEKFVKLIVSVIFYYMIKQIIIKKPNYLNIIISYAIKILPLYIIYLAYYYLIKFNVGYLGINTEYATRSGKNALAFMISILIAFTVVDILSKKEKVKQKLTGTILNSITIISIFLIQSRGLFLVFILYLIINFILSSSKLNLIGKSLKITCFVLIIVMVTIPDNFIESSLDRFSGIGVIFSENDSNIEELSASRSEMINRSIELFQENPLFGVGTGSFMYYGGTRTLISHNDYLLVLAEQGLIGITFFILLIVNFLKMAYINYIREKSSTNKGLLMAMFGVTFYFIFINAYDHILFWSLLAFISSRNVIYSHGINDNKIFLNSRIDK